MGVIFLLIGVVLFLAEIPLFLIFVGFRNGNCCRCNGYLKKEKHEKNKYVGAKCGRFYKDYIEYVYVYNVNGKEYTISGGAPGKTGDLPGNVKVIYQKSKPKYAYINKLTLPIQPIVFALLLPICAAFIVCGILLL